MSPLAVLGATPEAELHARIDELERDNHKLQRINAALIERVESATSRGDNAYGAFQHSVVLAEQVRERTDALSEAMVELKSSNQLLSDARLRAETAHQHLLDAIESISDASCCSIRNSASSSTTSASGLSGRRPAPVSVQGRGLPKCAVWHRAAG